MESGREALVVCGDGRKAKGITVWDMQTGEELLRIPNCAAAAHGLLCLSNGHTLLASQLSNHGSVASGSLVMWAFNKPHSPLRSYTMEAIGPLCSTRDGAYITAGASSGNIYLWQVASGRLLKSWSAHHKTVKCMAFSDDGSFLISGSNDGVICVWSMIRLLDVEDFENFSALLYCSSEHTSSITGLLTMTRSASLTFISSSLDGQWKVWDLISGSIVKTRVYGYAITAIAIHPADQLVFSGSIDGSIFLDAVDNTTPEASFADEQDQTVVLKGHNESITALKFCKTGLVSASKDCTVCIWDVENHEIIWRFIHQKGPATNLVIVPRCALFCGLDNQRGVDQSHASLFEKYSRPNDVAGDMITLLPSVSHNQMRREIQRNALLDQCLVDSQQENSAATTEILVEATMDERTWAMSMAKHVVEMNKHIRSCLLDMMQLRLWPEDIEPKPMANKMKKKKKKNRVIFS